MLQNVMAVDNGKIIGIHSAASCVSYDNTESGLISTNVQDAINEVCDDLSDKVDKVTGKGLSTNDYDDTAKGIVDGVTSALAGKVNTSSVGSANGVAELDANGKVPSAQLPSYVDDTIEGYLNSVDGKFYADSSYTTEITGETGKIYVTLDTNKTYRWSGSGFVEISESLALGETSSTAYAGNKGKANADAISAIKDGTNIDSFGDVETALAGKASTNDLGDKSNLTTTDKSSAVGAINEVNSYFVDLGPTSGANINAFFKNACTRFLALSPNRIKPHSIFAEWSQHNNYFGQIVDINDDVVVATFTSAGGSQVISGYYRVTGDEVVVYPYEPIINPSTASLTAKTVPGLTLNWLDNSPDSHKAIRVGNLVIVNVGLDIDGTFTGTTGWISVYELPDSLLRSGESFITPYFTSMMCTNRRDNTVYIQLIEGRRVWLDSSIDEYHLRISGQMILPIVKS